MSHTSLGWKLWIQTVWDSFYFKGSNKGEFQMRLCSEEVWVMTKSREKHSEQRRPIEIATRRPSHVLPSLYKYSMLQPQMTVQFQRGAIRSLLKSLITILHKAWKLRDCAITIPAIITDYAVPTQLSAPSKRSLVCNSNSSNNNTHEHAPRQATSYKDLQDATS